MCQTNQDGYISPKGFHRHECPKCGHVWEHSDSNRGNKEAHYCPKPMCDGYQRYQYTGNRAPAPERPADFYNISFDELF